MTKIKSVFSYTLGALFVLGAVALAGTLTPGEGVTTSTPTMYTLSDIYNKLTIPSYTPSEHTVSTTSSPAGTFNTLSQIYSAIPEYLTLSNSTTTVSLGIYEVTNLATVDTDLVATNILEGVTIFGVAGSATAGAAPLQWSADAPAGAVDWATAGAYCSGLGGGYRLPYLWELAQYFQQNGQGTFQAGSYWSSTENPFNPGSAYFVSMLNGFVYDLGKTNPDFLARCVR